jgi:hypothetical protein
VKDPEMDDIIDLVDEVLDDDTSQLDEVSEVVAEPDKDDDLIELTDVVEEGSPEPQFGDTALDVGVDEIIDLEIEESPEEEEPIELTDEVVPGVDLSKDEEPIELEDELALEDDSAQDDNLVFELFDTAEEPVADSDETESSELSEAETNIAETEDDSLADIFNLEMSVEGPETPVEQALEDDDFSLLDADEHPPADIVETGLESVDLSEVGLDEGETEPIAGALEQAVLERLTDDKLEEIVTSIVKSAIEEKVERILLEAAEAAIAREIERLKQAL